MALLSPSPQNRLSLATVTGSLWACVACLVLPPAGHWVLFSPPAWLRQQDAVVGPQPSQRLEVEGLAKVTQLADGGARWL